jgi:Cu/Ag efflux protein CusF
MRKFTSMVLAAMASLALTSTIEAAEYLGRIQKVDPDAGTVTVIPAQPSVETVVPEMKTFHVAKDAKILDEKGNKLADGLKDKALKEGAVIRIQHDTKDGKAVATEIKLTAE